MIISTIDSTSSTRQGGEEIRWRSLARRGMLHSECDSVDYVRLSPGTEFALRGREGTESAWFVLAGSGQLREPGSERGERSLDAGELVLLPTGAEARITSGDDGLELLWLVVMPRSISQSLPMRRPVA
ncbi:cupin domain-containing protein [Archangium lansingense]|uniref:cupin domain-containing protein n=1 Tax=Archangium lansingense TaxID=2995310 RepID=UPI003B75F08B